MGYLVGNDGGVHLGSHFAQFNTWNGTFSRQVSDITGFADSGRRRKLGVWDANGSAGGFMLVDAASSKPGINTTSWQTDGNAIYLHARGAGAQTTPSTAYTGTSGYCTMSLTAIISEVALSSTKTGDAAISFNWQLAGGAVPTETWDET